MDGGEISTNKKMVITDLTFLNEGARRAPLKLFLGVRGTD